MSPRVDWAGRATISNAIVAGNISGGVEDTANSVEETADSVEDDCGESSPNGKFVSKGHNLIGSTIGCGKTKFRESDILNEDAQLGSLQYTVGCAIEGQPPAGDSPAINAGNPGPLSGAAGNRATGCYRSINAVMHELRDSAISALFKLCRSSLRAGGSPDRQLSDGC
jgi:hypothetical protein